MKLPVVVKVTEIEPVKKFMDEIKRSKDKVEDGDISKETAYSLIMKALDIMLQEIKERADEGDDRTEEGGK